MGSAILNGLRLTLRDPAQVNQDHFSERLPTHFIACVSSYESAERLKAQVSVMNERQAGTIDVWVKRNVAAVEAADIVLLACHPSQARAILSEEGMGAALTNKLMMSICVGVDIPRLRQLIYDNHTTPSRAPCYIVHAMPNTASCVRQSATVISTADDSTPREVESTATRVFQSIGTVTQVPSLAMNAASVTAASTPAFYALVLEGVIRGAMQEGISESDATFMAAQAMKGTAEMVLQGQRPEVVREAVTTPQGCTARGVEALETENTRNVFATAIRQAVKRVSELGKRS